MSQSFFNSRQISYLTPWFEDVSTARMESLGVSGGFSRAVIWRVAMQDRQLCLRRWPQAHPTLQGLLTIHGLLKHVADDGCNVVPVPLPTHQGETYFINEDHLWELTPWMPGAATFASEPTTSKLVAAVQTLANFHRAAQSYRFQDRGADHGTSPGLQERFSLLTDLQQGGLEQLWRATRAAVPNDLRDIACDLLEGIGRSLDSVASELQRIVTVPLPLQWCIRDVRHDHLLFTDEKLTGLLDFGAVAIDSVAGDIARLLGSTINDHAESWQAGIRAYCQQRELTDAEQQAIIGFDHGGTLCSAANWARWLFLERRSFPQIHALHAQLVWLRDRLRVLAATGTASTASDLHGPSWSRNQPSSPSGGGTTPHSGTSPWMHT